MFTIKSISRAKDIRVGVALAAISSLVIAGSGVFAQSGVRELKRVEWQDSESDEGSAAPGTVFDEAEGMLLLDRSEPLRPEATTADHVTMLVPPKALDAVCFDGSRATTTTCGKHSDCATRQCSLKSRFLSLDFAETPAVPSALQVTVVGVPTVPPAVMTLPWSYPTMLGDVWWVGEATLQTNDQTPYWTAPLECTYEPLIRDWTTLDGLHVYGDAVIPGALFEIRMCETVDGPCSEPLTLATTRCGDVLPTYGLTNFGDFLVEREFTVPFSPIGLTKPHAWVAPSLLDPGAPFSLRQLSAVITCFSGGPPPPPDLPEANQCP